VDRGGKSFHTGRGFFDLGAGGTYVGRCTGACGFCRAGSGDWVIVTLLSGIYQLYFFGQVDALWKNSLFSNRDSPGLDVGVSG
jgi:hypothetical protein